MSVVNIVKCIFSNKFHIFTEFAVLLNGPVYPGPGPICPVLSICIFFVYGFKTVYLLQKLLFKTATSLSPISFLMPEPYFPTTFSSIPSHTSGMQDSKNHPASVLFFSYYIFIHFFNIRIVIRWSWHIYSNLTRFLGNILNLEAIIYLNYFLHTTCISFLITVLQENKWYFSVFRFVRFTCY